MSEVNLKDIKKEILEMTDEKLAKVQGLVARIHVLEKSGVSAKRQMSSEGVRVFGQLLEKYHDELASIFTVANFSVKDSKPKSK